MIGIIIRDADTRYARAVSWYDSVLYPLYKNSKCKNSYN